MKHLLILLLTTSSISLAWDFQERSEEIGLNFTHGFDENVTVGEPQIIASGLAIGDVNGDGWDDIFVVTGETKDENGANINPNKLYISQQDGTYVDMAEEFNLDSSDFQSSGPLILDINGNGTRDLIFGTVGDDKSVTLYENNNNETFTKGDSELPLSTTFGISAADTDKDGDLDLFVARWLLEPFQAYFLNDGTGKFTDVTPTRINSSSYINSFTPIFVDVNNDNWVDILLTSDFGSSQYFLNSSDGTMVRQDSESITDENGMGAAAGDYDNDGDLDWFVSSIFDADGFDEGNWGVTGNRLYNNDGSGTFVDVSDAAGVKNGYWGWGACFADFNNDMFLDIFHVNGFPTLSVGEGDFIEDPSRLFINDQNGGFVERSSQVNLTDTDMGRSILCFDNDRDGDIDILISNNQGQSKYYQNNLDNNNNYISIRLLQGNENIDAIGAKIQVTSGGETQLRQIQSGGNFASSSPAAQHFGLADQTQIDSIVITWPDGTIQELTDTLINQHLIIKKQPNITGVVSNSITNQPVADVTVKLFNSSGKFVQAVKTDQQGNYSFTAIVNNQYRIITEDENYVNQSYPSSQCGIASCNPMDSELLLVSEDGPQTSFSLTPSTSYYPNLNGSWYNAAQSGHGLQIEILSMQDLPAIYVTWYAHLDGKPIWLTGTGTLNKGIGTVDLYSTSGSSFPPNFNADDVTLTDWGTLNLDFTDSNNGNIEWTTINPDFENGSLAIERITNLSNNTTNTGALNACQSGAFYNADQSGHGIMLEVLGDDAERVLVTWFTYDTQDQQHWLLASGDINGNGAQLDAYYTKNSNFPPNFNANDVENVLWGVINLHKIDNDNLTMSWTPNSDHSEFGSNSIEFTRLTNIKGIDGLDCN